MTTTDTQPTNGTSTDCIPPPPDPLLESILADVRTMLAETTNARGLASISRYCGSAAQLLQSRATSKGKLRAADAANTVNDAGSIQPTSLAQYMPALDMNYGEDGVLAAAPASETYGVKAVRELMDALSKHQSKQNETPFALVRALAEARDLGLTDIVTELSAKLGVPATMTKPKRRKSRNKR
jgi:hypothetical protein